MTWLELVGASVIYIVSVLIVAYACAIGTLILNRKGGLEAFVLLPVVFFGISGVGAVAGAVLLGVQIGQMP